VPVFPGVLLAGAALAEMSSGWMNVLRAVLLAAAAAQLHYALGSDTRSVRARRAELIAAGRSLLQGSQRGAGVDVGWLGAASEQTIVDFSGVTDPEVAYLPGGHTSKRLPMDFLERRRVDTLVLRRWPAEERGVARWAYAVDARVLTLRGAQQFEQVGTIPLPGAGEYVVLRRRPEQP
jgi:hypothetical protein